MRRQLPNTRRYKPSMKRILLLKRKDGWMKKEVYIEDYLWYNKFKTKAKAFGRPWWS